MSIILYEDPTRGERLDVQLPLTFKADLKAIKTELNLPEYVDIENYQVASASVLSWAAHHADQMTKVGGKGTYSKTPIPIAFFGGIGFRLHCASANQSGGPFFRALNDLDLVTNKKRGRELVNLMSEQAHHFGTGYGYWITPPRQNV